jgi:hypothetical protein|tara:strand:- start:243 stop:797 length:555 start_codon:yes stop_codon:yes gene_type:complete
MSDFPFSIPRRVDIPTIPFSHKQTAANDSIVCEQWATGSGNEEKIEKLSGLLIKPNSESQKVLLQLHLLGEWSLNSYACSLSFKRVVDGVETWLDTHDETGLGNKKPCNAVFGVVSLPSDNNSTPETVSVILVDEPNTIKEVTYDVYLLNAATSSTFKLNRTKDDVDDANRERGISTFTAECKG